MEYPQCNENIKVIPVLPVSMVRVLFIDEDGDTEGAAQSY